MSKVDSAAVVGLVFEVHQNVFPLNISFLVKPLVTNTAALKACPQCYFKVN